MDYIDEFSAIDLDNFIVWFHPHDIIQKFCRTLILAMFADYLKYI